MSADDKALALAAEKPLNSKQLAFYENYLKLSHGTKAAIAAGYPEKSAKDAAWRLLRNPRIKAMLAATRSNVAARAEYTLETAMRECQENLEQARAAGQFMAVARFVEMRARITGVLHDKVHLKVETVSIADARREALQRAGVLPMPEPIEATFTRVPTADVVNPFSEE